MKQFLFSTVGVNKFSTDNGSRNKTTHAYYLELWRYPPEGLKMEMFKRSLLLESETRTGEK